MSEEFTTADLHRVFIVVPRDSGSGTVNLTVAQMSDKQFREWVTDKADMEGVRMVVPPGRLGLDTRANMLNQLSQHGVKIYKLGG